MLNKLARLLVPFAVFLTPLLFWNLTPNFFSSPKQLFLILVTLILFFSYALDIIKSKSIPIPRGTIVLPLLGMILAIGLNLIFVAEGRPEAVSTKGTLLILLPLLSLLLLTLSPRLHLTQSITHAILGSSLLLAIHSLLQLTYLHTATFLPVYMQTRNFTPTGSFLTTLILIILGGLTAIGALKPSPPKLRPLYLGIIVLTTIAAVAIISLMLPGSSLTLNLIPYRETWSITLDALKPIRSLFVGVGIANYPLLYAAVKPLSLNLTPLWNTLPQTGTSEILTLLATTGFLGFTALLSLIVSGFKLARLGQHPLVLPFILLVLALVFTPSSIPLYFLLFLLLPILDETKDQSLPLSPRSSWIVGILVLVGTIGLAIPAIRPYFAEYYLRQAQVALANNDGKGVYNAHLQAIKWYPSLTLTHLSYAETNLNLASGLSQKKDLTEADRSTITTLVQQAIREGKTGIQLRPNYSLGWSTLAQIYRNLINVATGADRFSMEYYSRAVALDPANPVLRVEYGGLFYQLGMVAEKASDKTALFARAQTEFQTAIQLRPTYANAYYNLSKVLETQKDYGNSYLSMQKVIANLDSSSSEYARALTELETLKTKLPPATPPTTPPTPEAGELQGPAPLPSPLPGGPINLSE